MSRLAIPLLGRTLRATGDLLLRAELSLALRTNKGTREEEVFLVDSGTEMTTMPASLAKQLDLPIPRHAAPGAIHRQTGLVIRSGFLWAQVVGMDQTEYVFPCLFLGDPDAPPGVGQPAVARNLLGLSGVVDKIRFLFDGTPASGAPFGNLIVAKV